MASLLGVTVEGLEALDKTITAGEAAQDKEAYSRAFAMFDADNNGTIDSSELPSVLQYMKEDTPAFAIHTLASQTDLEGDGRIHYHKFLELMSAYKRLWALARSIKAQRDYKALVSNTHAQIANAKSRNSTPPPRLNGSPSLRPLRVPKNVQSRRRMRQTRNVVKSSSHVFILNNGVHMPKKNRQAALKNNVARPRGATLRRGLLRTKEQMKNLDVKVKKGMRWVKQHCPVPHARAQMYCKRWAMQKLNALSNRLQKSRVSLAFRQWMDVAKMDRCQKLAEKYLLWKGLLLMDRSVRKIIIMDMRSAWDM